MVSQPIPGSYWIIPPSQSPVMVVGAVTSYSVSHQWSKFRSVSQSVSQSFSQSFSRSVCVYSRGEVDSVRPRFVIKKKNRKTRVRVRKAVTKQREKHYVFTFNPHKNLVFHRCSILSQILFIIFCWHKPLENLLLGFTATHRLRESLLLFYAHVEMAALRNCFSKKGVWNKVQRVSKPLYNRRTGWWLSAPTPKKMICNHSPD